MNKRKIQIGLFTFLAMVAAFIVYSLLVDTPNIMIDEEANEQNKVNAPDFDKEAGAVGDETKVATVDRAIFKTYDKKTKKIKQILGFEKLLNPESGTDLWRLQKPYMRMFEDKFKCDIQSDKGNVRVEKINNTVVPLSAELTENVVITIQMQEENKQIRIELDNLIYDNERSEFATDGNVKLVSEDGIMQGKGMILLYNAEVGKLAYLEITDLEYLLLKNVESSDNHVNTGSSVVAAGSPQDTEEKTSMGTTPKKSVLDDPEQEPAYKYYQCSLDKNVKIEYGKKIVVVGADEVVISNILWSDNNPEQSQTASAEAPKDQPDLIQEPVTEDIEEPITPVVATVFTQTSPDKIGENDILVQCEGSLIIRPMELAGMKPERIDIDNRRKMQIKGKPVKVGQPVDNETGIATIASCGMMTYDIDNEVLDLEAGDLERFVELSMANKQASIFTEGSVKWKRKANQAIIVGPGMLMVSEESQNDEKSPNMKFDGVMDVYFVDQPQLNTQTQQLSLSNVDLAGGMVVTLNNENNTVVASDTARINFSNGRQITHADLGGNVNLTSDHGSVSSNNAQIFFAMNDSGKTEPISVTSEGNATLEPADINSPKPTRFHAKKIEYDIITGKAIADGPVKFIFYPQQADTNAEQIPVVITAEKNAKYFPDENQVLFNGGVVGSRITTKIDMVQHETLKGDQLIVDLFKTEDESQRDEIKHIRVAGGVVQLRTQRAIDDYEVCDIALTCQQLDWGAFNNTVIAKGPGQIEIDNKNAPEPDSDDDGDASSLNLNSPCQAMISGFKSLAWDLDDSQLKADGGDGSVNIGYLPIKNGQQGQVVRAAAGNITCNLEENSDGRFDIVFIRTYDGIIYEEVGKHSIIGDRMDYTGKTGVMVIKGTDSEPCIVDGRARTSYVEYDTKTGRITSQLSR